MAVTVDLRVTQLLCSRLCHDLAGAAGAVNAGLELLEDGGVGGDTGGAASLVASSAKQVTNRLQFFRAAFGMGGGVDGSLADARKLAMTLVAGGNVALEWPASVGANATVAVAPDAQRLLLVVVLLAVESLPRGGTVSVRFAVLDGGLGVAVAARGAGARIKEDLLGALSGRASVDDLTARNVHGFFALRLAESVNATIETNQDEADAIQFAALLPLKG